MIKYKLILTTLLITLLIPFIYLNHHNQEKFKKSNLLTNLNKNEELSKEKLKLSNLSYDQSNQKKDVIISNALLFGNFDSTEALMKDSNLVVKGTVIASEPYIFMNEDDSGTPYTKLKFKIKKVIIGDKNLKETIITILEYGGEITKNEFGLNKKGTKLSTSESQEKIKVMLEGIPNSTVGQNIIAFLTDDTGTLYTDYKFYGIMGGYKGRFTYDPKSKKYNRGTPMHITDNEREKELKINEEITDLNNKIDS